VRDQESFLEEAFASLSAQTFADFEVIVVDDGSADRSGAIALDHARDDRRFRIVQQPAAGIVVALRRAAAEARGRYLARMDGDDVALPDRLALQVEALEADALDACGGGIEYFPREAVRDGARRYERWINGLVTVEAARRDVFVECPLPHPTIVVRREAFAAVGGYRECGWPEDYDLLLRLWARGARFRNVRDIVLRWREHDTRASRTRDEYSLDAFRRCKVHHLRTTLLASRPEVVIWGAGPVGKAFAREFLRQRKCVAAFVDVDPRKIGHEVAGAPVVSVDDAPLFADAFAIGAVSGDEGRARVREFATALGRREGVDFVAVA
jgi:cellulose synthase/poly-beta-1,6-N-acetylglucosamine synthase-like glycosyltransferase